MNTLTIQPNIKNNRLYSYSEQTIFKTLGVHDNGSYGNACIIEFAVNWDEILASSSISKAQLYLYLYTWAYNPSGRAIKVYRVLRTDYNEDYACWRYYKQNTQWTMKGCLGEGTDYTATDWVNAIVPTSLGWMNWDITNQVLTARSLNRNVICKLIDEGGSYSYCGFAPRDYSDVSLRPKLVIEYTPQVICFHSGLSERRYKSATFSGFTFPNPAGSGFSSIDDGYALIAGYGGNPSVGLAYYPIVSEILKLGDNAITQQTFSFVLNESIKLSDSATNFLKLYLSLASGVKLSEALSYVGKVYINLSENVKLSDSTILLKQLYASAADGFKLSDSASLALAWLLSVTDGLQLSDSNGYIFELNPVITDGIKLSDIASIQAIFAQLEHDGIKLSDSLQLLKLLFEEIADGIKLADMISLKGMVYIPPSIYRLEIRDAEGKLLGLLKNAYNIELEEKLNEPKRLTFFSPADDEKLSSITRAAEIWVRDTNTDIVIAKTRLERRDDKR